MYLIYLYFQKIDHDQQKLSEKNTGNERLTFQWSSHETDFIKSCITFTCDDLSTKQIEPCC